MNDKPSPEQWVQLPSGLIVGEDVARAVARPRPLCGSFFSGCGGFDLGFVQGGFDVVFAVEIDVSALITYMVNLCRYGQFELHFTSEQYQNKFADQLLKMYGKNFEKENGKLPIAGSGYIASQPKSSGTAHVICGDVRELTGAQIMQWCGLQKGELDCVIGGPPCQGFSSAGKKDVMDPRNSLVFEYARLVCELQPKTMVMENVPQIINMVTPEGIPVVDQFAMILEDGDFGKYLTMKKALEAQAGIKLGRCRSFGKKDGKNHRVKKTECQRHEAEALELFK